MGLSSFEAENNFVVLHSSTRSIFQGFDFITHIFLKVIKGQDPLEGVEVGTSKYLPGTWSTTDFFLVSFNLA